MSIISPADLEASPLADLHALASALGIDGFRRLRKDELVDAILARQGAAPPRRARASSRRTSAAPARARRRTTTRREARRGAPRSAATPSAPRTSERPAARRAPAPAARRPPPRRRRGRSAAPAGAARARGARERGAERVAEGVVELLANGSGFLRVNADEAPTTTSTSPPRRRAAASWSPATDQRAGAPGAALRASPVAGPDRHDQRRRRRGGVVGTRIDDIDVDFPTERFALAPTIRRSAIGGSPPFGRGSRVLIAGPPRSGEARLLRRLAAALAATEGLDVELLAVGVRPEELSEYKQLAHATSSGAVVRRLRRRAGGGRRAGRRARPADRAARRRRRAADRHARRSRPAARRDARWRPRETCAAPAR